MSDPIDAALLELQRQAEAANPTMRRLGAIGVDACATIIGNLRRASATPESAPAADRVGVVLALILRAQDMIEALTEEQRAELEQRMAEHRLSQIEDTDEEGDDEDVEDGDEDSDDGSRATSSDASDLEPRRVAEDDLDEASAHAGEPRREPPSDLDDMTRAELQAFAREHSLDVDLRRGEDNLREAIRAALAPKT